MTDTIVGVIAALVVIVSSIWVTLDARRNQIADTGAKFWGAACLLLWIIAFPLYLIVRTGRLEARGQRRKAIPALATVASGISIAIATYFFMKSPTWNRLSTEELEGQVRASIEEAWKKDPSLPSATIDSFKLVQKQGNEYVGMLEVHADGKPVKLVVDVTYDGHGFLWKTRR